MTPERWYQVVAVFQPAIERPPVERAAFLDEACSGDHELRSEVELLLAAAAESDDFLETPAAEAALAVHGTADILVRLQAVLGSDYRVERELSGGGMSQVFLAQDTRLGRRVVVKALPAALGTSLDVERFHREVRLAASLRHPHIVPLLDAGEGADGLVYFTMPFIEGESLRRRLDREGALPLTDVVRIVREVADALAYAHGRGVVHRDIKPGNVLVDGDHFVVADFGIAKALNSGLGTRDSGLGIRKSEVGEDQPEPSRENQVANPSPESLVPSPENLVQVPSPESRPLGTPGYMSPEQARGDRDIDARSDVYSLGCMTFEMFTGKRPFARTAHAPDVDLRSTVSGGAPSASALREGLPDEIDRVIVRALAPRRNDRFASATEFADALSDAMQPRAEPTPTPQTAEHPRPRRRVIVLGAVALLAISAVAFASLWRSVNPEGAATDARPTVAVLSFENLGPAVDDYFADGVADELTTRLGEVHLLRVISRTSTRAYKGTSRPLREVGRELGADYVLEGTVQWERAGDGGGRVRVRPRLVKVSDDSQVWADTFDSDLGDVFALEGTIGERVAGTLAVAIGGSEQVALHQRPTDNFEAYNYFLRGEALRIAQDSVGAWRTAIAFYDTAITLDPTFALALARRAQLQSMSYWGSHSAVSSLLERARIDAERAVALDPALLEARLALALYYYRGRRDYKRALSELSLGLARQPNNADLLFTRAAILRRTGRFREAVQAFAYVTVLDPRSPSAALETAGTYLRLDEFAEAERYATRAIAIDPVYPEAHALRAFVALKGRGDVEAARRIVREALPSLNVGSFLARLRLQAPWLVPVGAASDSIVERLTSETFGATPGDFLLWMSNWHRQRGSQGRGRAYADSARTVLERTVEEVPDNAEAFSSLAIANAFLGRKEEALRSSARAVALLPLDVDAAVGYQVLEEQALVSALVGEREQSIEILERVLSVPNEISVPFLEVDPIWSPLRGDPRFERLLARHR